SFYTLTRQFTTDVTLTSPFSTFHRGFPTIYMHPQNVYVPFGYFNNRRIPYIDSYTVYAQPFRIPFPEERFYFGRPSFRTFPPQVSVSLSYRELHGAPVLKDGGLGASFPMSNELFADVSASGVKLLESIDLNLLRLNYSSYRKITGTLSGELDMLFKKQGQTIGETIVFLENKQWGYAQGFYNDGKNWFALDLYLRDGKIVSGGGFAGEIDLEPIKAAAQYRKVGKNDVFYTVIHLPPTGTAVAAVKTFDGKKEILLNQTLSAGFDLRVGYFELSPEFFGSKTGNVKGVSIGGRYNDVGGGSVYLGTEDKGIDVVGLSGVIKDTYISAFVRKNGDKITHGNVGFSTVQKLGEDTQLTLSTKQILREEGKPIGSGTIELTIGKKGKSTRLAFGYDNITSAEFWKKVDDYGRALTVNTTVDLFAATTEFINRDLTSNAPYPLWMFEFQNEEGKITGYRGTHKIFKNKEGGGGVGYTSQEKDLSWTIYTQDKKLRAKDLGISFSKSFGNKTEFAFQLGNKRIVVGAQFDNLSLQVASVGGRGHLGKVIYELPNNTRVGMVAGTIPVKIETETKSPLFVGGMVERGIGEPISYFANVSYIPTAGLFGIGGGVEANFINKNLRLNLTMQALYGKIRPSRIWGLTLRYNF
ncbi:MAG: hypothetical protein N3G80_03475, partial [Candidatus Micrarchaeota archaeon]|nr:hypothetical protein [Candidatus Micrarchaeota archaeon]